MMVYEVFRGPGNRLVAVGTKPVGSEWNVRSGTQGSRLKVSTFSQAEFPSVDDVKGSVLTSRYVHEFTGEISPHGTPLRSETSFSLFWEAFGIPIESFTRSLFHLRKMSVDAGIDLDFTHDSTGTFFSYGQHCFGMSTSGVRPGCVSSVNRRGAGSLTRDGSVSLAAFAVYCSRLFHKPNEGVRFALAANVDETLSAQQILERVAEGISAQEAALFELLELRPISLMLRPHSQHRYPINF